MKPHVFISSTSEFAAERQELGRELGKLYDPYLHEEDVAQGESPQKRCRAKIKESHVFVVILGIQYGSPLPSDAKGRSIVEWEFDTAHARKAELEIMPFLKKLPPAATVEDRQRSFIDRVRNFRSGMWCKFFDSASELVRLVRDALEQWALSYWRMQQAQLAPRRQEVTRLVRLQQYVAIGTAVLVIAVAVVQFALQVFSNVSVILSCALAAVLMGTAIVMLLISRGDPNQ